MRSRNLQDSFIRSYSERWRTLPLLLILALLTLALAPALGSVTIPPKLVAKAVIDSITGKRLSLDEMIIVDLRIPRVLMAFIAGMALSTAGVVMQAIFRNPLAEPFVLGVSAGAAVGAIIGMLAFFSVYVISISAFLSSMLAVFAVYNLAKVRGKITTESLLLAGIAVNFFLYALEWLMLVKFNRAHLILTWLVGFLGNVEWLDVKVSIVPVLAGILSIWIFARDLNAMTFGEETAHYLGINVATVRKLLLAMASLITAVCTSFVGVIGFVGLMIPHMLRMTVGADHRVLIPSSALFGGIFLVWTDTFARTVMNDSVPVGIITMLCGAPFFIYLLRSRFTKFS